MAKKGISIPGEAVEEVALKANKLSTSAKSKMANLLGKLRADGHSIQIDLYPSVNAALVNMGVDAYMGMICLSDPQKDAVPSTLQKGEYSDTILLENLQGEREKAVFYASNGGAKSKLASLRKGYGVLLYYRGTVKSKKAGMNDWHDIGMEAFPRPEKLVETLQALNA